MSPEHPNTRRRRHARRTFARAARVALVRCAALLFLSFACALVALAQRPEPTPADNSRADADTPEKSSAVRGRRAEEYSESGARQQGSLFGAADPATILREARTVYIRSRSVYFKDTELENELRRHPEFHQMGLAVTRHAEGADLVIEVGRKVFTTRFVYSVVDPRSLLVVMSGKVSSVGGTAADKIAGEFVRKILAVRSLNPNIKIIR